MKVTILILLLMVCVHSSSDACTCTTIPVYKYLSQNDTLPLHERVLVIKGKVANSNIGDSIFNVYKQGNIVNIKIEQFWPQDGLKFLDGNIITIFNDGEDCSVKFKKDSTYLIRARRIGLYLSTSECEGTKLISHELVKADLQFLGVGAKPSSSPKEVLLNSGEELIINYKLFFLVSAVINLLLFLLFLRKKKH